MNIDQHIEQTNLQPTTPYAWIQERLRQRAANATDLLLTVAQAQPLLGGISRRTVHRMIFAGKLRATRFGKAGWWRISAGEVKRLRAALEAQKGTSHEKA